MFARFFHRSCATFKCQIDVSVCFLFLYLLYIAKPQATTTTTKSTVATSPSKATPNTENGKKDPVDSQVDGYSEVTLCQDKVIRKAYVKASETKIEITHRNCKLAGWLDTSQDKGLLYVLKMLLGKWEQMCTWAGKGRGTWQQEWDRNKSQLNR